VTGVLFGFHPIHVESVAWAAERKDLLCALFFLLSITMYTISARTECHEAPQGELFLRLFNKRHLITLGFFILALLSKPMAVTLPAVLLILDWYPFGTLRSVKTFWTAIVAKLPFVTLSLASSVMAISAQKAEGALLSADSVSMSIRFPVAAKSLIAYLGKMLLPVDLVPLYPYPRDVSLFSIEYLAAILLVTGITAACVVLAKKQQVWLAAWGYYVLTLIPVLGIIQVGNQAMADRYTYLPSLGPFLIAGLYAAGIAEKVRTWKRGGMLTKAVIVPIAILAVAGLSVLTIQQTAVWRNSLGLWTYVIDKEPERFPLAYNNRGMVFLKSGQLDKAISDFDRAITLDPQYAKAYYNRGLAYDMLGRLDQAILNYKKTIALNPFYYEAYYYLDQASKKSGDIPIK
jgi:hypothetical protein